ncbi:MAG: hypothetical protein QOE33_1219 [Acidobacteriota bacterium]|nr:hypothetical protein [Acidobacteriota bacterium]
MGDEDSDLEKWRKENAIPSEEMQRLHSPELRMLDLVERLTTRVETNEEHTKHRAEETLRNIEFIIQQQAQFTADMQRMREAQESAEKRWERSEQRWERTEESIRALLTIAEIHDAEIKALAETQAEAQSRTDRQMSETDVRLNALVNVIERVIGERRNGGGGNAG